MIRALYRGDCLNILEEQIETESVDLVYLDPPFNSKSDYNLPFKVKDKTHKAVEVFKDTWAWQDTPDDSGLSDNDRLEALHRHPKLREIAFLIDFARQSDTPQNSMGSYILSMALRLQAIHNILKPTGSLYLHCDPTASHYLKLVMDSIFGKPHFQNEIIWCYERGSRSKSQFGRKHDVILFYSKTKNYVFDSDAVRVERRKTHMKVETDSEGRTWQVKKDAKSGKVYRYSTDVGVLCLDWWTGIQQLNRNEKERLGYPTQKPLALLERIIKASSNPDDVVLDPFCGCGTAVHAAESLGRQWIGVDISRFSVSLINERILSNFNGVLDQTDIALYGQPETIADARRLAQADRFEFEKWACGKIGAYGMATRVGEPGADGGIDGIIEFWAIQNGKPKKHTAIVQVKSGHVTPDSVRALDTVVRRSGSVSGIMLCFANRMRTVENQKGNDTWSDDYKTYPVIQGFSVEDLIAGKRPNLPPLYGERRGGNVSSVFR